MKFLSTLTPRQITAIATALSSSAPIPVPPIPPVVNQPTFTRPVIGNRYMIKENLKEIFLADANRDASDTNIDTIIENHIGTHSEAFGGNCTRYDAGCMPQACGPNGDGACVGTLSGHMTASPSPTSSPIAKGYLFRACEEALTVDKSVQTALLKAGLSTTSPINAANVTTLMRFLYRQRPTDANVVSKLVAVAVEGQNKGYTPLDQWRFVILPMCTSAAADLL